MGSVSVRRGLLTPKLVRYFRLLRRIRFRKQIAVALLAMGFALVYAAEHYVIDVLFGWLYAAVVYFAGCRIADRYATRRSRSRAERTLIEVSPATVNPVG